ELPLREVFAAPTLAGQAAQIEAGSRAAPTARPPVLPASRKRLSSFGQRRLFVLAELDPASPAYHVPAAFRLSGKLDERALEESFAALAMRHEILRTTFLEEAGEVLQVVAPSAQVSLPVEDLRGVDRSARDERLARILQAEARAPFDLRKGPLF